MKKFLVIGNPIDHSLSPKLHNYWIKQNKIDAIYEKQKMEDKDLKKYLSRISDEALYAYNVYQIEGVGRNLFSEIEGDENTIMGLPIKKIKEYLNKI